MNILLIVTSVILVIGALTYSRLESYRKTEVLQQFFTRYEQTVERGWVNQNAQKHYRDNTLSKAPSKKIVENAPKKAAADISSQKSPTSYGRISLSLFLKPGNEQQKEYPLLYGILKKLIVLLYKDQPFFKEMEIKRPDAINAFIASLSTVDTLPKEKFAKIKKIEDLANITLGDPDMDYLLYQMFQGTAQNFKVAPPQRSINQTDEKNEEEVIDREDEYSSIDGYLSLRDFLTLKKSTKIRVWLAPPKLLEAIFENPDLVRNIITMRQELYRKLRSKKENFETKEASTIFENTFAPEVPHFKDILDFSASRTNPNF